MDFDQATGNTAEVCVTETAFVVFNVQASMWEYKFNRPLRGIPFEEVADIDVAYDIVQKRNFASSKVASTEIISRRTPFNGF